MNLYEGKIAIYKDPYGDNWKPSDEDDISAEDFRRANRNHQLEVMMCMDYISTMISKAGQRHDFTKDSQSGLFFRDFINWKLNGEDMDNGEWFPMHVKAERHHLKDNVPDDVNLVDVIEMICDCVCAGLARSGELRPIKIDSDILQKAVQNTVELVKNKCYIIGGDMGTDIVIAHGDDYEDDVQVSKDMASIGEKVAEGFEAGIEETE